MLIGLASYKFINNNVEFNISQIERALQIADGVDLLCFGEAFLQGFDAFCWSYVNDQAVAISKNSNTMQRIENLSKQYATDLAFGYLEADGESLYSSYAIIINGKLAFNYRRISAGWKEYELTDSHYKEGTEILTFFYKGHNVAVALCGDLWEYPQRFASDDLLIWPVYVDFTVDEWAEEEAEYSKQAQLACNHTLMINSLSENSDCHGGCFYFADGKTCQKLNFDVEDVLVVRI
ncbi:MAG: carbon-nitrogen hydrolase family protein [Clostridia bacterium]|nr:carbon-nitrogen hydrolase family protein [Clostridia bacterium]